MQLDERRVILLLASLILTFLITRLILHRRPNWDLNVGKYNVHHLFTGIILIALAGIPLVIGSGSSRLFDGATIVFGIGLSLALDQWVYLITTDGTNASYVRPISLWGGTVMIALACGYIAVFYFLFRMRRA